MLDFFSEYLKDIEIDSVCITGPRPHKLWGLNIKFLDNYMKISDSVYEILLYLKKYQGLTTFISGGAQGIDHLGFYVADKIKNQYGNLNNILYIPFRDFGYTWEKSKRSADDKLFTYAKFQKYKEMADDIKYMSDKKKPATNYEFSDLCQLRNEKMVDNTKLVIGIYSGKVDDFKTVNKIKGGTLNCLKYAYKQNKPILIINPYTLEYTFVMPELTLMDVR